MSVPPIPCPIHPIPTYKNKCDSCFMMLNLKKTRETRHFRDTINAVATGYADPELLTEIPGGEVAWILKSNIKTMRVKEGIGVIFHSGPLTPDEVVRRFLDGQGLQNVAELRGSDPEFLARFVTKVHRLRFFLGPVHVSDAKEWASRWQRQRFNRRFAERILAAPTSPDDQANKIKNKHHKINANCEIKSDIHNGSFPTQESAQSAAFEQMTVYSKLLRTYRCPSCQQWHLTSNTGIVVRPSGRRIN